MAKQKVALECLSYHATAPQEETDKITVLVNQKATPRHHFSLTTFP